MKIAKLNRDDMGDHLNRADLGSGNRMVVLFQDQSRSRKTLSKRTAPTIRLSPFPRKISSLWHKK